MESRAILAAAADGNSKPLVNEINHVRAGACRWHVGCIETMTIGQ